MAQDVLEILKRCGMVREGHFIGKKTKKHLATFIDKEALFSKPEELKQVAALVAKNITELCPDAEVIVAPLTGGALLGIVVSTELPQLSFVVAEKTGGGYFFRRTYAERIQGRRVVLLDDVVRTGASLAGLERAVLACGGTVVAGLVVAQRGTPEVRLTPGGAPIHALVDLREKSYNEEAVPAWLAAIPVSQTQGDPKSTLRVIGVTGRVGSGKTTVVSRLLEKLPSAERIATSDTLRETLTRLELPITRENLLKLSKALRNSFGDSVTLRVLSKKMHDSDARTVVIDGVRSLELVELIRTYTHSLIVFVESSEELRYTRITERSEKTDERSISREAFQKLDRLGFQRNLDEIRKHADIIIDNNASHAQVLKEIDRIIVHPLLR